MISSRKTKFLIILLLILAISFGAANFAHAAGALTSFFGSLVDFTAEAVFNIVGAILAAIGFVLGLILALEGMILDYVLSLTNLSNAPVVLVGWGITRDLANMFFILVMIWIAFTTILQIETYRTKELVTRLIIVALLINFSLVIAGVIIDFTQVITDFFISQASGGAAGGTLQLSASLAKGLQISSYYQPSPAQNAQAVLAQAASIPLMVVAGSAFAVIFSGLAIFVFAAAIILFVVRIVALWFLLIVSPIAWAASIMPDTKHLWDRWWKEFLRWAFFAPAYSFFIYLALLIVQMNGVKGQFPLVAMVGDNPVTPLAANSSPSAILNMVLVIVILIAGIKVAESMGAYGAAETMKYAKKWGNQAKDYTGRMGRRAAVATGAPQAIAKQLSRVPLLRQAARPLRKFEETEREARAQRVNQSKERVKGWTKENAAAEYRAAFDPQTKAGLLLGLSAKWQGLSALDREEKISGLKTLQNLDMQNELMTVLRKEPTLAPTVGKTIEDVVKRISPSDIKDMSPDVISNPEVARFFNQGQLRSIFNEGLSEAFAKAFPKANELGFTVAGTADYLLSSPGWASIISGLETVAIKEEKKGEQPKEEKAGEQPRVTLAGKYAGVPPQGERKG